MCECACGKKKYLDDHLQIEIDFGYCPQSESYKDGYQTGIEWDANWMPGGPAIYSPSCVRGHETPEQIERAKQSQFNHDQWIEGFKVGLKIRLATNEHFATWWNANRKEGGQRRYKAPGE